MAVIDFQLHFLLIAPDLPRHKILYRKQGFIEPSFPAVLDHRLPTSDGKAPFAPCHDFEAGHGLAENGLPTGAAADLGRMELFQALI